MANNSESIDESEPLFPSEPEENCWSNRIKFYLDPGVFLLFFGWNLSGTILINEILVQTCHVTYNFSETDCLELGQKHESPEVKEIEETIQPYVAKILMARMMLESVVPAILSLILGPFSDRFGRKLILNSTSLGLTLYFASLCVLKYLTPYLPISPWYYALSVLFFSLSGGFSVILTGVLSHTTDSSTERNRSERITIIELMIFAGVLLGTFTSSYLVMVMTTFHIFLTSFICIMISTIYIIFFIEETVIVTQENRNLRGCDKFKTLFSVESVTNLFMTCLQKRTERKRSVLWLMMIVLMLTIFALQGTSNIFYLFEREKFNWTVKDANLYDSATMTISIFGTLSGLFVLKHLLKVPDIIIIVVSLGSKIAATVVITLATLWWHLYFASMIGFIGSLYGSMCRSMISQSVERHEIGKIFAVTTALEAVSTLIAAPFYTFIYTKTYKNFASAFNLITIAILTINVILSLIVTFLQNRPRNHNQPSPYGTISTDN